MAVIVNDCAHTDPRLTACARALRMSRPALLVACMQIWGRVQAQGHTRMRVELVAGALGKRPAAVSAAVGLYELAEVAGDTLDLSPMADLFGDDVDEHASDYELGNPDERRRERARERQRRRRERDRSSDVTSGVTLCHADERDMSHPASRSVTPDVTPESVTVTRDTPPSPPAPFSPPTPPPIPPPLSTPPPDNTHRAGAREGGAAVAHSGTGEISELYAHYVAVIQRVAPPGAIRILAEPNVVHEISECLHHRSIHGASTADVKRGLDILGAESKARADAGEQNPWWSLSEAWNPRVMLRALKTRDESEARARAVRRSGRPQSRPGVKTAPNEHYQTLGIGECEI